MMVFAHLAIAIAMSLVVTVVLYGCWGMICNLRTYKQRTTMLCLATREELEAWRNGPKYHDHMKALMAFSDPWKMYGDLGERGRLACSKRPKA